MCGHVDMGGWGSKIDPRNDKKIEKLTDSIENFYFISTMLTIAQQTT